ncbi:MAG: hypothetical protein ACK5XS_03320 [Armatimonadota bacterium]|jgi:hypothetical protein|nr:hypothetical protein [Fimbriimonadaceae bacterium]MCZ8171110.1 hypothetical protein [Brevundimonas sp.]
MKSQNNQGQGKWESRLLDWESRISDGAWWGIYIFAVLGLLHIAIVPFFERQFFGQGGVYALVCLQVIVGLLVRFKVIRITPKELALYQVGFIFLWFAYIPSWFYWGDDRPWHQRGLAEQFLGLYVMCATGAAPWSAILIQTTYRLRWFVSIPLAVLLCWMAFIMFFMSYGMITNNWL